MKLLEDQDPWADGLSDALSGAPGLRVGDVIGERYELLECIGAGAMGSVFQAQDRLLDARIAMKLIRVDTGHPDAARATQRLLLEARAIARISHPGIVRVFDFGCVGGVPFIAMELLSGESLLELMVREGPLEPARAVRLLLPIADAIAVAHRRSVVHRDIKPENVFFAKDELGRIQPKLVDFGVARLREGESRLTRPGALMGTPDYMAPEQAQAEPDVDHRADVWAFGVVLYELMTTRRPFSDGAHASYLTILRAIVREPPKSMLELGVNEPELWGILVRALEKRRDQRWQSMREFGAALAGWLLDKGYTEDAYGASLRAHWLGGSEAPPPGDGDEEWRALRKTRPHQTDSSGATLPPPATAAPALIALSHGPAARALSHGDGSPKDAMLRVGRPSHGTLQSSPLRRLSPFALAFVAALLAALVTASVLLASVKYWRGARAASSEPALGGARAP